MSVSSVELNSSTYDQIIKQYPIGLLKLVLRKLKIRELFKQYVIEPRSRVDHYDLDTMLMHYLFLHIFRFPSKNEYRQFLLEPVASNALALFNGGSSSCPSIRAVNDVIKRLNIEDFQHILPAIFRMLCRQKVFISHPEWIPNEEYSVVIDAHVVHTYHEDSQHDCRKCPYCLKRTRGNKAWYLHMDVVACFVAPNKMKIPLLIHRIQARPEWGNLGEGQWKQECERSAFPLILKRLKDEFPRLPFCILLDSLYATHPILTLLEEMNMNYCIVKKAKVLKTVGQDCEGLKKLSTPITTIQETAHFQIKQTIHIFNDVEYRKHHLSILQVDETAERKPSKRISKVKMIKTHWEWIISERLNQKNASQCAQKARYRWLGEDYNNDIKNRGFASKHDFYRDSNAQLITSIFIAIAHIVSTAIRFCKLGRDFLSKGARTLSYLMSDTLLDSLVRAPREILLDWCPKQLRWSTGPLSHQPAT